MLGNSLSQNIIKRILARQLWVFVQSVLGNLNIGYFILIEYGSHLFLVVMMCLESVRGVIKSVTSKLKNLSATRVLVKEFRQIVIFVSNSPVLRMWLEWNPRAPNCLLLFFLIDLRNRLRHFLEN